MRTLDLSFGPYMRGRMSAEIGQPMVGGTVGERTAGDGDLVGYPYRLRELRRALEHINKSNRQLCLTTSGAIADYVAKLPSGTVPGDT